MYRIYDVSGNSFGNSVNGNVADMKCARPGVSLGGPGGGVIISKCAFTLDIPHNCVARSLIVTDLILRDMFQYNPSNSLQWSILILKIATFENEAVVVGEGRVRTSREPRSTTLPFQHTLHHTLRVTSSTELDDLSYIEI